MHATLPTGRFRNIAVQMLKQRRKPRGPFYWKPAMLFNPHAPNRTRLSLALRDAAGEYGKPWLLFHQEAFLELSYISVEPPAPAQFTWPTKRCQVQLFSSWSLGNVHATQAMLVVGVCRMRDWNGLLEGEARSWRVFLHLERQWLQAGLYVRHILCLDRLGRRQYAAVQACQTQDD